MIGVDSRLRPKPQVIVTDLDDEAVLLDMEAKRYFGLNDTGLVVWRAVVEGGTPRDAAAALVRGFEVTEAEALESTLELCDELVEAGLLVAVEAQ